MSKSGTGTWGVGRRAWALQLETRDAGTRARGTARHRETGAQEHDKQIKPDFCAEFLKSQSF